MPISLVDVRSTTGKRVRPVSAMRWTITRSGSSGKASIGVSRVIDASAAAASGGRLIHERLQLHTRNDTEQMTTLVDDRIETLGSLGRIDTERLGKRRQRR